MATQEEKKVGIWAILAPVLSELGHEGIDWLIGKLHAHKATIQPVDAKAADIHQCPPGQVWSDIAGKCVADIG